jgi:glycine oxidase
VVRAPFPTSLAIWKESYPGVTMNGTLVVAGTRDRADLERFARMTEGFDRIDAAGVDALEPGLEGRFAAGLYYRAEGHLEPGLAMPALLEAARQAGVDIATSVAWHKGGPDSAAGETVIDCRGLAARGELPELRGVRGERLIVRSREVRLQRPVRLLHPRHPLYVVPWSDGRFMIGATVIESEDAGPITVRSALELLGAAYTLHPAFAEAEILDAGAGVRPAFPDNVPRIVVAGRTLHVNGLYRHGFLLAPALAQQVAWHLEGGATDPRVFIHRTV